MTTGYKPLTTDSASPEPFPPRNIFLLQFNAEWSRPPSDFALLRYFFCVFFALFRIHHRSYGMKFLVVARLGPPFGAGYDLRQVCNLGEEQVQGVE